MRRTRWSSMQTHHSGLCRTQRFDVLGPLSIRCRPLTHQPSSPIPSLDAYAAGVMTSEGIIPSTRAFGSFGIPYTTTRVQDASAERGASEAPRVSAPRYPLPNGRQVDLLRRLLFRQPHPEKRDRDGSALRPGLRARSGHLLELQVQARTLRSCGCDSRADRSLWNMETGIALVRPNDLGQRHRHRHRLGQGQRPCGDRSSQEWTGAIRRRYHRVHGVRMEQLFIRDLAKDRKSAYSRSHNPRLSIPAGWWRDHATDGWTELHDGPVSAEPASAWQVKHSTDGSSGSGNRGSESMFARFTPRRWRASPPCQGCSAPVAYSRSIGVTLAIGRIERIPRAIKALILLVAVRQNTRYPECQRWHLRRRQYPTRQGRCSTLCNRVIRRRSSLAALGYVRASRVARPRPFGSRRRPIARPVIVCVSRRLVRRDSRIVPLEPRSRRHPRVGRVTTAQRT